MKKVSTAIKTVMALTAGFVMGAQQVAAEEFTAVVDIVLGVGTKMGNTGAMPTKRNSIGLILSVKGKSYKQNKKTGQPVEFGDIDQLSIVMPEKVGERTNAQDICLRRAEALMAKENRKARLEVAFDGQRVAHAHYRIDKLIGCSDLRVNVNAFKPTPTPRPTVTPRVTVTPQATAAPRATATPIAVVTPRPTATPTR